MVRSVLKNFISFFVLTLLVLAVGRIASADEAPNQGEADGKNFATSRFEFDADRSRTGQV